MTDLDNIASPFLRYKTGDLTTVSPHACDCGRYGIVLRHIEGRIGDCIVGLNGARLHPEFFTHLLNETGVSSRRGLKQYQVRQEVAESLQWFVVSDPLEQSDVRILTSKLVEYLGPVEVQIVNVETIPPSSSGKFQYVVSKIGHLASENRLNAQG